MNARSTLPAAAAMLVAGLAMLLTGVVSGASAGVRGTTPSVLTFSDPAGDSSGAPDITTVTINGAAATKTITFSVTAAGLRPTTSDGLVRFVDFYLNTDRDRSTGSAGGSEFVIDLWSDAPDPAPFKYFVGRWNGDGWQSVPQSPTLRASRKGDVYTVTASTGDLGGATAFSFDIMSGTINKAGNLIARDDGNDFSWVYDIAGPTQSMIVFATPTIGKPTTSPAVVRAGRRLTVSFPVTTSSFGKTRPLTRGTMICDPSVRGKVIRHAESFANGIARLSFVVPSTTKGKDLKVKVTIKAASYEDEAGVWIDIGRGEQGLLSNFVSGKSTTKVVTLPIR